MTSRAQLEQDWASAPGETVADLLDERSLSRKELARYLELGEEEIDALISGALPIGTAIARSLETVFGSSTRFWLTRESDYRADLASIRERTDPESVKKAWVRQLPVADMVKFGWIPASKAAVERADSCLAFFGVEAVSTWYRAYGRMLDAAAFRTSASFTSQRGAVAAWLRKGELKAEEIHCEPWNKEGLRQAIPQLRALTRDSDPNAYVPAIVDICAQFGVAVAVVRAPQACRASGASRFVSSTRAVIILSFRHLSDDHFWFTFFHELAHLLLHGKKDVFVDGFEEANDRQAKEEQQADELAGRILIPEEYETELRQLRPWARDVMRFALRIGVSRGIVVGQLQHRRLVGPHQLNRLKRYYNWDELAL